MKILEREAVEQLLAELCEGGTFGPNIELDLDGIGDETMKSGQAVVGFSLTGVGRDIISTGVGEVLFMHDSASNENAWCEGSLVAVIATSSGHLVIDTGYGSPEYCDDESDCWLSGQATWFERNEDATTHGKVLAKQQYVEFGIESIKCSLTYLRHADLAAVREALEKDDGELLLLLRELISEQESAPA